MRKKNRIYNQHLTVSMIGETLGISEGLCESFVSLSISTSVS